VPHRSLFRILEAKETLATRNGRELAVAQSTSQTRLAATGKMNEGLDCNLKKFGEPKQAEPDCTVCMVYRRIKYIFLVLYLVTSDTLQQVRSLASFSSVLLQKKSDHH
jgi:hypothetical protein